MMKISLRSQAIMRKNSDICIVTEHPIKDELMDFAIVKINGRYPHQQRVTNLLCKEIVYVHQGHGKVVVEGKEHSLGAGDVVLIEAGEKYYWEGDLHLFISCRPAFTKEQHQLVD